MSNINKDYVDFAGLSLFKGLLASLMDAKISAMETFTGASSQADGASGLVPAPEQGDQEKFLRGDGEWAAMIQGKNIYVGTVSSWESLTADQRKEYDFTVFIDS